MLQLKSKISVGDNSGVQEVECIYILKKKKVGLIGDYCLAIIKRLFSFNKKGKRRVFKIGSLNKCLIVQVKKNIKRFDGSCIKFFKNVVILLNESFAPIGTRIGSLIGTEVLKKKESRRIASIATIIF